MKDRIPEKLQGLLLTLLLSAGLSLTFLGALGLDAPFFPCLALMAGGALLLEGIFLTRRSALWGGLALAALLLAWALSDGGFSLLSDLLRALTLQVSGVPGALPLISREASLLLTAFLTLISFLSTRKSAGAAPALILFVGSLIVIWQTDRPDLILRLLPAGLASACLLVRDHHPGVSLLRVLPCAAALLLGSWLLIPPGGLTVPALKDRADAFRQAVMDRLFFTEPREVFSLSTEGFYPQGVTQLGGPAAPTDHPVMQVSAPRTVYLRGVVMNEYDGRAWRNSLGGRRFLWSASGLAPQRTVLFDQNLPSSGLASSLTEPREVSVRMLSSGASTLFLPQRVRELRAGGELVPYFTNSSEVFLTRNLQPGDTWSVTAPLMQAGDPGLGTLVDAAGAAEDPQYDSVLETYTALPSHLEAPVWQLAAEITENLSSPYEKAFALQNYLSRNYRYTLDAAYQPADRDFVTHFLFTSREGYCTYFASALTVLCRMAGLPARYVEGYLAVPGESGEALVTGLNAHAWTEVYFRGFGWLTLDATPRQASGSGRPESSSSGTQTPPPPDQKTSPEPPDSSSAPTPTPEPEDAQEPPAPSAQPEDQPPEDQPPEEEPPAAPFVPPLWLLPLLLLLLLAGAVWLRWFLTSPAHKEKRASSEEDRFDIWMEDVLRRLSAAGLVRRSGETLMSFTRRLDQEEPLPLSLSRLGECASLLHYGKVQALDTDTELARSASLDLKKGTPFPARLRYALRRLSFRQKSELSAGA